MIHVHQPVADRIGVFASIACLIHRLLLPLRVPLSPLPAFGTLGVLMLAGAALPVAAADPGANPHGAHQHGVARLDVVVEGSTLLIGLDSPLANLLGFEHPPRSERERSALGKMEAALRAAGAFKPNAEAACTLGAVALEPSFGAAPSGRKAAVGHADAEVSWTFHCAAPGALRQIEVELFARFAGLKSLQVQLAGPRGQSASVLSRSQRRLAW